MSENPRVLIQIALMNDGKIGVTSTSTNHITNLGLLGVAQSMFQKGVGNEDQSTIIKPELGIKL